MRLISLIFLLFLTSALFSQENIEIKGVLVDSVNKKAIPYATIQLKNNDVFWAGTISDTLGFFEINHKILSKVNGLNIIINDIGYQQKKIRIVHNRINLGTIFLKSRVIMLKSVEVVGSRNKRTVLLNKIIIVPDSTRLKSSTNVISYLQKIAGLRVNKRNKTVTILGKSGSAKILINGVPSGGVDLMSINANQIDHIEIIRNSSVEYGSQVKGVINVVLKKRKQGYKADIHLEASSNWVDDNSYISLKYTYGKISYFLYYGFSIMSKGATENLVINNYYNTAASFDKSITADKNNLGLYSHNFKYGVNIFLNKNNLINIISKSKLYNFSGTDKILTQLFYKDVLNNTIHSIDLWSSKSANHNYSFYFKHTFSKTSNLSFYNNLYFYKGNFIDNFNNRSDTTKNNEISNYAKISYEKNFNKKATIEAGYNLYIRHISNYFNSQNTQINLEFKEVRNSFYGQFFYQLFKKLSANIGVRYENSNMQLYNGQHKIMNLFLPTFGFKYKLSKKNNFVFTMNKELNYPTYTQLEPFPYYSADSLSYSIGNPHLIPEELYSFRLSYNYFRNNSFYFTTALFYHPSRKIFSDVRTLEVNNVIKQAIVNTSLSFVTGISLDITYKPIPVWMIDVYFNVSHYKIENGSFKNEGNAFSFSLYTSINFSKTLSLNINGYIQPKAYELQGYTKPIYMVPNNIALTKLLFKRKVTLTVGWAMPFIHYTSESYYRNNDFNMFTKSSFPFQAVYVNFTYSLFKGENRKIKINGYVGDNNQK